MSFAEVASAATRWLSYTALVVVGGAITVQWAVARSAWPPTVRPLEGPAVATVARVARIAVVVLALATILRLVAQVHSFLDAGERATLASYATMVSGTGWGRGWEIQAGAATFLLVAVLSAKGSLGWWPARIATLATIVSTPLTGHATEGPGGLSLNVAAHAAHLLAACSWVGGLSVLLAVVAVVTRRGSAEEGELLALLVRRFSPIALGSVPTLLAAGGIMTWMYVGTFDAFGSTWYGRLALGKLLVFGAMAALGAWNWRRATPRLGQPGAPAILQRVASIEAALGFAAVLITAALVGLAAPALGVGE